jgi:hypothetical protein
MIKLLRSPRIDSKELIPPGYVAYSYSVPSPYRLFKNSSTGKGEEMSIHGTLKGSNIV